MRKIDIDNSDIAFMLLSNVLEITFTKTNGDIRVMNATLMKEHLPEQKTEIETKPTRNSTAIRCFDVDKQEWRSFRPETVKQVIIT